MYQHITDSVPHRKKYLVRKNIITQDQDISNEAVHAYAEEYERKYGRHIEQIKIIKVIGKQGFKNSENLSDVNNTRCSDVRPLRSTDVGDRGGVSKSLFHNIHDISVESRKTSMDSEDCFRGRYDGMTSLNNAGTINEEICEYSGTTNSGSSDSRTTNSGTSDSRTADCLDNSDNEDAISVITISSSAHSDASLSDMEEDEESNHVTNYNFSSSYDDVAKRAANQNDSAGSTNDIWNPTKMECLQLFMEQSEPLVIETQLQWEFLVSVIQAVSEAVEKCNVQNLPP